MTPRASSPSPLPDRSCTCTWKKSEKVYHAAFDPKMAPADQLQVFEERLSGVVKGLMFLNYTHMTTESYKTLHSKTVEHWCGQISAAVVDQMKVLLAGRQGAAHRRGTPCSAGHRRRLEPWRLSGAHSSELVPQCAFRGTRHVNGLLAQGSAREPA